MHLAKFLEENNVPELGPIDRSERSQLRVECRVVARSSSDLVFCVYGSEYYVALADVIDVEKSGRPIVTASDRGTAATLTISADAVVYQKRSIAARELAGPLPLALGTRSKTAYSFDEKRYRRHQDWLRVRGFLQDRFEIGTSSDTFSGTTSSAWTETTSPVSGDPRFPADYVADDSDGDGMPPDDGENDDISNDDVG